VFGNAQEKGTGACEIAEKLRNKAKARIDNFFIFILKF
jgi:hypothetical protein